MESSNYILTIYTYNNACFSIIFLSPENRTTDIAADEFL